MSSKIELGSIALLVGAEICAYKADPPEKLLRQIRGYIVGKHNILYNSLGMQEEEDQPLLLWSDFSSGSGWVIQCKTYIQLCVYEGCFTFPGRSPDSRRFV